MAVQALFGLNDEARTLKLNIILPLGLEVRRDRRTPASATFTNDDVQHDFLRNDEHTASQITILAASSLPGVIFGEPDAFEAPW